MNGTQFAYLIRLRTRTNSTTLPNADIVSLANYIKEKLAKKAVAVDPTVFNVPLTANLIVDGGVIQREYPFPSTILSKIISVKAKLDGSKFITLTEMGEDEFNKPDTEDIITSYFSNNEGGARYKVTRNTIKIYSGSFSAVTGGLKLLTNLWPADLTTSDLTGSDDLSIDPTTTTFRLPRELHDVWVDGVVIQWKSSREKPIPLTKEELNWDVYADNAVEVAKHGKLGNSFVAELPDSSKEGDNGFNY